MANEIIANKKNIATIATTLPLDLVFVSISINFIVYVSFSLS